MVCSSANAVGPVRDVVGVLAVVPLPGVEVAVHLLGLVPNVVDELVVLFLVHVVHDDGEDDSDDGYSRAHLEDQGLVFLLDWDESLI